MSGIGGNDPTGYNYGAAETLKTKAGNLQGKLYGQKGARASAVWKAMQEFRGHYSEVFDRNAEVANNGRREVANALGDLTRYVEELIQAAEAEDRRREEARAWAERQRQRENNLLVGAWHEVSSWFGAGDDPQPPPADPPPNRQSETVNVSGREVPTPSGGSTTSSAVPADLRHFQTRIGELDDELATAVSDFATALGDYETGCNSAWGTLDGRPVLTSVNTWLEDNGEDATWAGTVAQAFEAAGGDGRITLPDAAITASLQNAGVDSHRDTLTIEPFSAVGSQPTTGFADDPVNTSTGNFLEPEHDLEFSGRAVSLRFSRMYNSLDDRTGAFGLGWSSVLDTRVEFDDEGARFIMSDGRQITFPRAADGWDRGVGENYWLHQTVPARLRGVEAVPETALTVTDNNGNWWAFTAAGTWIAAGSGPGSTVTVVRDDSEAITQLVHELGRFIDVEYAEGRVVSVSASDGRRIEYLYDDQRRLTAATGPAGTRTYRWNDQGLIDQVVAADGVVEVVNTYDKHGRVTRQLTPYGRSVRFSYLRGRVTSVSTDDGTGANTWIADRKGRVVGIVDSDGNRQSMAYDPHGNIVAATDRDGQVTVHAYDDRGRKIRTVTPDGADLTYGYDEHDRVTTLVTASGGVVEYHYATAAERNPSIIIDPVGGRTELTWDNGLLTQVIDPEGVQLTFAYDRFGDLVGVTNAAGGTSQLRRDQAGRLVEAISPGGARTTYRYNAAGQLVGRQDPDGATWEFEIGDAGKIATIIDPYGHRTELAYGPAGDLRSTTDPLGRTLTRELDAMGNLASLTLPDGTQWNFTHDALSRLREVIDPMGGTWSRDYDVTGDVSAITDPTGVRSAVTRARTNGLSTVRNAFDESRVELDEYGRPVRMEHTDGTEELVAYDACGRPVELVDGDGGLTKIERDLAGRVIAVTTPNDHTVRYEYDACGRPVATESSTGARTTLTYDADSRVIALTDPAGEKTTRDYDAMGRVTRQVSPGHGVARYRYDKLGRLVAVQDVRYGQRKFGYDAAGQLVKITNGVGGVTTYTYDERGRLVRITDPTGGVTTHTYTDLDQVASATDPLGRTTTVTYDAAGRQLTQTDPDGHVTQWVYDDTGQQIGLKVDDRWVAQIESDERNRSILVTDHTRATGEVTHRLTYNRLGLLNQRVTTLDATDQTTQWEYDAGGMRTAMIDNAGRRTQYHRDILGRVTRVTHPTLGEVTLAYDAGGKIREARAKDQYHTWEYANGFPVLHTRKDPAGESTTRISRDETGRITALENAEGITTFSYDAACQLVQASGPAGVTSWGYDPGGRLIQEDTPSGHRQLTYDAAGQLQSVTAADGTQTMYHYDGQGRRVSTESGDATVHYAWDARGRLTGIVEATPQARRTTDLWVNALGELAGVDGQSLLWDLGASMPNLIGVDELPVLHGPAGLTGIGTDWSASGWRTARATDAHEPWQSLPADGEHLPGGLQLGADGGLQIAGLEWLGARAYDPGARGFLSVDPLAPPAGAGWSANPYSYAGNDPLHAVDPLGLAAITDAELASYADGLQGPLASGFNAAVDWTKDNWEYIAAGAVVVAGIAVMATGVGGPIGAAMISGALISGGVSIGTQKHYNGEVNWGQVATEAAIGGAMGGLGVGASNVTSSLLLRQSASARAAVTTHAANPQVARAGTGVSSMISGNTKLAAASRVEAQSSYNMLVDNFVRNAAGETVSTMTTANAEYLVDVVRDPNKDLSFEGVIAANGSGLFEATLSTTVNFGSGGINMPTDVAPSAPISDKLTRLTREVGTDAAIDPLSNFIGWKIEEGIGGEVTDEQQAAGTLNSGFRSIGGGLHTSFPNLHVGGH